MGRGSWLNRRRTALLMTVFFIGHLAHAAQDAKPEAYSFFSCTKKRAKQLINPWTGPGGSHAALGGLGGTFYGSAFACCCCPTPGSICCMAGLCCLFGVNVQHHHFSQVADWRHQTQLFNVGDIVSVERGTDCTRAREPIAKNGIVVEKDVPVDGCIAKHEHCEGLKIQFFASEQPDDGHGVYFVDNVTTITLLESAAIAQSRREHFSQNTLRRLNKSKTKSRTSGYPLPRDTPEPTAHLLPTAEPAYDISSVLSGKHGGSPKHAAPSQSMAEEECKTDGALLDVKYPGNKK